MATGAGDQFWETQPRLLWHLEGRGGRVRCAWRSGRSKPFRGDPWPRPGRQSCRGRASILFLDPCGLGIPFSVLVQTLSGPRAATWPPTEILLNFSLDAVRRIAGHVTSPTPDETSMARLDAVLGGAWWRSWLTTASPTKRSMRSSEGSWTAWAQRQECRPLRFQCSAIPLTSRSIYSFSEQGALSVYGILRMTRPVPLEMVGYLRRPGICGTREEGWYRADVPCVASYAAAKSE